MYLVLILSILKRFSQGLIGALYLGEFFSQLLIAGLQLANLTLLLIKSKQKAEKEVNISNVAAKLLPHLFPLSPEFEYFAHCLYKKELPSL